MTRSLARPTCVPRRTTLLALLHSLARQGIPEREIVATVLELVDGGQVVLIGNFRGLPLSDDDEGCD